MPFPTLNNRTITLIVYDFIRSRRGRRALSILLYKLSLGLMLFQNKTFKHKCDYLRFTIKHLYPIGLAR